MGKKQKLRDRVLSVPADLSWSELVLYLKHLGFDNINESGGSHRKFYNKQSDTLICCYEPHNPKIVKKYLIRQIIEKLEESGDL